MICCVITDVAVEGNNKKINKVNTRNVHPPHQFVVDGRTDKAMYGLVDAVAPNGVLNSKIDALKGSVTFVVQNV